MADKVDGRSPTAPHHWRPVSCGMRQDPTNLDHLAYTIVGLGIFGWVLALLLR